MQQRLMCGSHSCATVCSTSTLCLAVGGKQRGAGAAEEVQGHVPHARGRKHERVCVHLHLQQRTRQGDLRRTVNRRTLHLTAFRAVRLTCTLLLNTAWQSACAVAIPALLGRWVHMSCGRTTVRRLARGDAYSAENALHSIGFDKKTSMLNFTPEPQPAALVTSPSKGHPRHSQFQCAAHHATHSTTSSSIEHLQTTTCTADR